MLMITVYGCSVKKHDEMSACCAEFILGGDYSNLIATSDNYVYYK